MHLAANLLLVLTWVLAQRRAIAWLGQGLLTSEGTLHLVLAVGLVAWIAREARPREAFARLQAPADGPMSAWLLAAFLPLGLAVWGPALRSADGAALVLSAYGLVGLFTTPDTWRRLRPLGLLGAAVLPLTGHLDVLLGLPLRTHIAGAVAQLLGSLDSATVLQVDGGFAHVDLPCAGVRSLWSSAVVLAAAAWVWGRPVGLRWLGILVLTAALVVLGNGARVALIVSLHHTLHQPLAAEVLHTPVGVLTFVAALAPGLALLRGLPAPAAPSPAPTRPAPWRVAPALLALAAVTWVPERAVVVRPSPVPMLPPGWVELAPTDAERTFVTGRGGEIRKARFQHGAIEGSVAWISSRSWLAQHTPELCYESGGWALTADHPARVASTPVRWAGLERGPHDATALWWFESAHDATDDQTARIAAGLFDDAPWLLVSVRVEGTVTPDHPDVIGLVHDLRAANRRTFAPLASLDTR